MPPSDSRVDEAALQDISLLCGVDTAQIADVYDCTPYQQAIAVALGKSEDTYARRFVISLSAELDIAKLPNAINEVVALNSILRTRIVDSQRLGLVQVVLDDPAIGTNILSSELDKCVEEHRRTPMALGTPLFRSTVIKDVHKWVLTIHHWIFDHHSLVSMFDDVVRICREQPPSVHAPFKHFVNYCGSVCQSEARDFWGKQFTGTPSVFPSVPINSRIDASSRTSRRFRTPADLASPALLPVYLECAWALLAHAYSGGDSVAYGSIYSGRSASTAWEGMDSTLGPNIAILPTQIVIDREDTVGELLKRRQLGRQRVQGCGAAMQTGLKTIREVSESAKRASEFQTIINIYPTAALSADSSPIHIDYEYDVHRSYAIHLMFSLETSAGVDLQKHGFGVLAYFDESLVSLTAMNRLLVQLEHVLQTLSRAAGDTHIGDLTLLSSRDRLQTLKWSTAIAEPVNETLHATVRKMAIDHPKDTAVDSWDGQLTYLELVTMADNLAATLSQHGVTRQSVIPCLFESSRWAIVAALAVLTAGGICVNLEPSHPRARHQKLLKLIEPHLLLSSTASAEKADGLAPWVLTVSAETVRKSAASRDQIKDNDQGEQNAYIIFTSGKNGTPKGVVLQHRALVTSLTSTGRYMGWQHGFRALQSTSYVRNTSIAEIFGTLVFGGCVCIPSAAQRKCGLADYMNAVGVEWAFQTPTDLRKLSMEGLPALKTLVTGGERIHPETVSIWGSKLRLVHTWGPCESSIFATFADVGPHFRSLETIGKPVGCAVWIADPINPARLVPIGAIGELIIESATISNGYFCNEDTVAAAAFIDPPIWAPRRSPTLARSRRFYRTGDRGRYNDDGGICFVRHLTN